MYINPIHAGPVGFAHTLALATCSQTRSEDSGHRESLECTSRMRGFKPLRRLAQWWRQLDKDAGLTADPVQLMLLSEPAGRPYATALSGLLLMDHICKNRATALSRVRGAAVGLRLT